MLQKLQKKLQVQQNLRNNKGFTLIELIVVIAIIAILAAVLIPRFTGFTESAREKSAISDARNILVSFEALDAQGDLTASPVAADVASVQVNDYVGKDIITNEDGTAANADGESSISAVTHSAANGIGFTYTKYIGSDTYVVVVANSVIPDVVS